MTQLFQLAFYTTVLLTGYSLLTAGKHGRGWFFISVLIGIAMVLVHGLLSLFMEITAPYSSSDWDEE